MSKKYTPQEFKQILPTLPWAFEAWVDHNPEGEGERAKLKFLNDDFSISSSFCYQGDIKNVDYAWSSEWLDGTYKGTFELVDSPLQHTKPIVYKVGDWVEVLENARECGGYEFWHQEIKEVVGKVFQIYECFDDIEGVYCRLGNFYLPHYCLRKVDGPKPEQKKTVTLELTEEQLAKIKEIIN